MISLIRLIILAISLNSYCSAADKSHPIRVNSKSAFLNKKNGYSIFTGNAIATQGSLVLKGYKIEVFNKNNDVIKVIGYGGKNNQAHYEQDRSRFERFIEAKADKISYFVNEELVRLEGNAFILQGYDKFTGGTLDYDIKNDRVIAKKSEDGKERVKFKIRL